MSFRDAKGYFDQALAMAQLKQDHLQEQFLVRGLLEMNQAIQSSMKDMESRLRTLETLVRRLDD